MSELRILDSKVLLIPYKVKETKAGIILSKKSFDIELPVFYIVSAVGPNVQNKEIVEGAVVYIPRKTGKWVPFNDFRYILVDESDILAILEGVHVENPKENIDESELKS